MAKGARVLLVEDMKYTARRIGRELEELGIEAIIANTLAEAEVLFTQHKDQLDGIILDGCVDGEEFDAPPFIYWVMVQGFEGVFMANSLNPGHNATMMKIGCTVAAHKDTAARIMARELSTS